MCARPVVQKLSFWDVDNDIDDDDATPADWSCVMFI